MINVRRIDALVVAFSRLHTPDPVSCCCLYRKCFTEDRDRIEIGISVKLRGNKEYNKEEQKMSQCFKGTFNETS